jgi:hypothetical protein
MKTLRMVVVAVLLGIVGCSDNQSNRSTRTGSVPRRDRSDSEVEACVERGVQYFKDIGSYPTLSSPPNKGRSAEVVARERCNRTTTAFP